MINRTVLVGRLTKDPELRYTGSGVAVATFTVAVNRQFTNQQGEREADFINCVMWRKAAENFCNFTHKGSLVGLDGQIQTRFYDNQQGQRVYVTEVIVGNFSLLESKAQSGQHNTAGNNNFNQTPNNNNYRQSNNNTAPNSNNYGQSSNKSAQNNSYGQQNNQWTQKNNPNDPFANGGQSIDINDDDLPF